MTATTHRPWFDSGRGLPEASGILRAYVRFLLMAAALMTAFAWAPSEAQAQYKNGQIGFEGGYMFIGSKSGLDSHGVLLGLRGAYKGSDNWWFTARAGVSFRGEEFSDRTVVLFHLVPAAVRYYFFTDRFRPFLGVTNSFQFLANNTGPSNVFWGPGVNGGFEIRLKRDLYLGFQTDAYWMFVFQGPDAPIITTMAQLNFFL